jgi:hypothetical protein
MGVADLAGNEHCCVQPLQDVFWVSSKAKDRSEKLQKLLEEFGCRRR